mmetsp:Transcript_46896/g.124034  ORF Transcript_46896/g.124034 Transcript_46896/m.124034 type:complete len:282 (+) Transcript_46896:213-1058(+)
MRHGAALAEPGRRRKQRPRSKSPRRKRSRTAHEKEGIHHIAWDAALSLVQVSSSRRSKVSSVSSLSRLSCEISFCILATTSSIILSIASSVSSLAFFSARIISWSREISSVARLSTRASIASRARVSSCKLSCSLGMSTSRYLRKLASFSSLILPSFPTSSRRDAVRSSKAFRSLVSESRRACCSASRDCCSLASMAASSLALASATPSRATLSSSNSLSYFCNCSLSTLNFFMDASACVCMRSSIVRSLPCKLSNLEERSASRPLWRPLSRSDSLWIRSW